MGVATNYHQTPVTAEANYDNHQLTTGTLRLFILTTRHSETQLMNTKLVLGSSVLIIGISALAYSVWRTAPRPAPTQDIGTLEILAKKARQTDASSATALRTSVEEISLPISTPHQQKLRAAIRQTINAYTDPNISAYLDLMAAQGIEPSERIANDPDAAQEYWDSTRAMLVASHLDLTGAIVLHTIHKGQAQYPSDDPPFSKVRRDNGRPFLKAIGPDKFEVAELRIPGTYPTAEGQTFDGDFIIQLTYNPNSGQWVLTEFRVSNTPMMATVMIPPL